jgi:hypothetical protein
VKNPQRTVPRDAIVDHDDDTVMVSIATRAGVYRARRFRRTSSCACFSTSRYESSISRPYPDKKTFPALLRGPMASKVNPALPSLCTDTTSSSPWSTSVSLGHAYRATVFVNGRSIAQPISRQRVLGFQITWPFSFFRLASCVENSSFSATI